MKALIHGRFRGLDGNAAVFDLATGPAAAPLATLRIVLLESDIGRVTLQRPNGYRLELACCCGVMFERWVTVNRTRSLWTSSRLRRWEPRRSTMGAKKRKPTPGSEPPAAELPELPERSIVALRRRI